MPGLLLGANIVERAQILWTSKPALKPLSTSHFERKSESNRVLKSESLFWNWRTYTQSHWKDLVVTLRLLTLDMLKTDLSFKIETAFAVLSAYRI